ncbi:MAG: hypothetical protein WAT93_12530 [Pontixanthobacter sp.]
MTRFLKVFWLAALFVVGQAASVASAKPLTKLEFSEAQRSQSFEELGVKVTIQTIPDGEWTSKAIAAVEASGYPMVLVDLGSTNTGFDYEVGIGNLSTNAVAPSVIIKRFTGGAHCCFQTTILYPQSGKMTPIDFGMRDAGTDFYDLPEDIDGDGNVDFVMRDGAFLYSFTNYAASWAPPKIINLYKGNIIDVSSEVGFRRIFEDFSIQSKEACTDSSDPYRNGACAAYVASEARLGRLNAALNFVDEHAYEGEGIVLPSDCKVELIEYVCPKDQDISFTSFYAAIRWFLRKHDYI